MIYTVYQLIRRFKGVHIKTQWPYFFGTPESTVQCVQLAEVWYTVLHSAALAVERLSICLSPSPTATQNHNNRLASGEP